MAEKAKEIEELIYEVDGQWIMLDTDLARFYGYETRRLNEQVKRNECSFTKEEMFKLTKEQFDDLMSQICDIKGEENTHGGRRHAPYVFTKQGVKVLGVILNSYDSMNITKKLLEAFSFKESSGSKVSKIMMNTENIRNMIYTIRGEQVMLDCDLATIYGYEVKNLNRQVKNNIDKFPSDMMFQLTLEEYQNLKCNFFTSSWNEHGGQRKLPNVFTEQGIYMLATVLKGKLATQQTLLIIRTFKNMRHYLVENSTLLDSNIIANLSMEIGKLQEQSKEDLIRTSELEMDKEYHEEKIEDMESHLFEIDTKIDILLNKFMDESMVKQWVFVDGQKFEADEAYIHIYKQAKQTIFVIDDYVSIKTLSHLKHKNTTIQVILFSDNKAGKEKLTSTEINDFNFQYPYLCLYPTHKLAHDRLIVLDYGTQNETIYMCGASSKDAGNKFCTILKVYEPSAYHEIIKKLMNT